MALKIVLQILSPLPLTRREDGALIFNIWKECLPHLLPDVFGNWEPVSIRFDKNNVGAALDAWRWPFLAVKRAPLVDVGVWMRKGGQHLHSTLIFRLSPDAADYKELLGFLRAATRALKADFGCLHLLTPSELARGRASGVVSALNKKGTQFSFLIGSRDLQERIPDVFWATVFGAPYVAMFGKGRLLSAPVYNAEAVTDDTVLLQTTEKLFDVDCNRGDFERIRSQTRAHLGEAAFFQTTRQSGEGYDVPSFRFFPTCDDPKNGSRSEGVTT